MTHRREGICGFCGRFDLDISEHHLIPRTTHGNKRTKRMFSGEEMTSRKVDSCQPCHKAVHTFWSEKELALEFNTVDKIKADPRMAKHIMWARKQKPGHHMKGGRHGQKTKRF